MRLGVLGFGRGGKGLDFRVRRTEDEREPVGVGLSGSEQSSGLGEIDVVHDRVVRDALLRRAGETQADALELAAAVAKRAVEPVPWSGLMRVTEPFSWVYRWQGMLWSPSW